MQHAWPNASTACFDITRPDLCGLSLTQRPCGFKHYVTNLCNGLEVAVALADCGPNTHDFCGERTCCGSHCASNRIIDLTPAAFSKIASLSTGLRPVSVDIT
jgi:hypothetical protein